MDLKPQATTARFQLRLPEGPIELLGTLRRADGTECGAYYAGVSWLGE